MKSCHIGKRWQSAYGRRMAKWLGRRPFSLRPARPLVTFTFDDFPRSALFTGGDILEQINARATYYVAMGLESQLIETGEMFKADDLNRLLERGHELGCHTFHHCSAWDASTVDYISSVNRNVIALYSLPQRIRPQTHSFPISHPRPSTKRQLRHQFRACRFGGQTHNRGNIDLNYLSSFFIEQSVEDFNAVQKSIAANAANGGWLIFSTHDVAELHTRFGCSPVFFEKVARAALESGAAILPMSEALDELGVPGLRQGM